MDPSVAALLDVVPWEPFSVSVLTPDQLPAYNAALAANILTLDAATGLVTRVRTYLHKYLGGHEWQRLTWKPVEDPEYREDGLQIIQHESELVPVVDGDSLIYHINFSCPDLIKVVFATSADFGETWKSTALVLNTVEPTNRMSCIKQPTIPTDATHATRLVRRVIVADQSISREALKGVRADVYVTNS